MRRMRVILLVATCLAVAGPAAAQEPGGRTRLYLDCQSPGCHDGDFFQREIPFVAWMRNRQDADLHVLITSQPTGGGGRSYELFFLGRGRYAGVEDTLRFASQPAATDDELRRGLLRPLKLGLVPYLTDTPEAERLELVYRAPDTVEEEGAASPALDPWDAWRFGVSLNGFFNGESSSGSNNTYGRLFANRVTETWKLSLSVNGNRSFSRFELDDRTVENEVRNYGGGGLLTRALGPHLSAGITASARQSSFQNMDLQVRVAPAVEYDIFPYAESSRRSLVLRYTVGASHFDYEEITIFDKLKEQRTDHALQVGLDLTQPWGSVNVSLEGSQYLSDLSQNRLTAGGGFDVRLIKGLSFNLHGNYSRVHDQLSISARDLSEEEVLLRRQQLATDYRYFASFGLSYSFGSAFNTVVNPRFSGFSF